MNRFLVGIRSVVEFFAWSGCSRERGEDEGDEHKCDTGEGLPTRPGAGEGAEKRAENMSHKVIHR